MSFRAISARLLVVLAILLGLSSGVLAQSRDLPKVVTVGVYVNPPFVIKRGNSYEGLAFELWQYGFATPLGSKYLGVEL
jgi:hypothetical protein